MAFVSPTTFPHSIRISDPPHTLHKLTYTNPRFTRLNLTYSSTLFTHFHLPRVLDSSTVCRCQRSSFNEGTSKDDDDDDDDDRSRGWESVFQQNVKNVIKWFDDYLAGYWKNNNNNDNNNNEVVVVDGGEEWDWERWKRHFEEMDEQERMVSFLQDLLIGRSRLSCGAILLCEFDEFSIIAEVHDDTVGRLRHDAFVNLMNLVPQGAYVPNRDKSLEKPHCTIVIIVTITAIVAATTGSLISTIGANGSLFMAKHVLTVCLRRGGDDCRVVICPGKAPCEVFGYLVIFHRHIKCVLQQLLRQQPQHEKRVLKPTYMKLLRHEDLCSKEERNSANSHAHEMVKSLRYMASF
ncbi:hypothetical protein M8C21_003406, partial [Ambrosia artemisiifolia]